jgi:hypothetical protein
MNKEPEPSIKMDDLTVGELAAMKLTSASIGIMRKLDKKRLQMLIERMSKGNAADQIGLSMFKLMLFFVTEFNERLDKDTKFKEALEEMDQREMMQHVIGGN